MLAITSPVFEGMFFGPLADRNLREVRVEDVKPTGFKRLIHFIYNSRCLSWKIEDAEEQRHILEAANKHMNTRPVEHVARTHRETAKRAAGNGARGGPYDKCGPRVLPRTWLRKMPRFGGPCAVSGGFNMAGSWRRAVLSEFVSRCF